MTHHPVRHLHPISHSAHVVGRDADLTALLPAKPPNWSRQTVGHWYVAPIVERRCKPLLLLEGARSYSSQDGLHRLCGGGCCIQRALRPVLHPRRPAKVHVACQKQDPRSSSSVTCHRNSP